MTTARKPAWFSDVRRRTRITVPLTMEPHHRSVRVLLVDDNPLFLRGLAALLAETASIEIVGLAENGSQAVVLAEQLRPDIVVMDVQMPVQGGVSATRSIVRLVPDAKVILLTALGVDDWRHGPSAIGAYAFLSKDAAVGEIAAMIRAAAEGDIPDRRAAAAPGDELTRREVEILSMLAIGYHSGRIAIELRLQPKTVRNYISVIYEKLGIDSRSRAVLYAVRSGLLDNVG